MANNVYTTILLATLIGSTVCVIPDGEIQIGPVFGHGLGSRFFGNKHFEAVFEKGAHLKPLIAKKVLFGVGALGAGALAAGGAALLANKCPHLHKGWGWGNNAHAGYGHDHGQNYNQAPSYGWNNNGGHYQAAADVKFPATSGYPSSQYDNSNNYNYAPPATDYGYPQNQWQSSSDSGSYGSYGSGWAR